MVLKKGPQGKRHFPSYRNGCYYRRLSDCCWLCMVRLATDSTSPINYRIREANTTFEHDFVGERLRVPNIGQGSNETPLEYIGGTVVEVHMLSGNDLDILTILTDDDQFIHIDLTAGPLEPSKPT